MQGTNRRATSQLRIDLYLVALRHLLGSAVPHRCLICLVQRTWDCHIWCHITADSIEVAEYY